MRMRRSVLLLASILLGALLVWLLIRLGKVDLLAMRHQIGQVSLANFGKLALLNGLLIQLSTMRWRIIDAALRHPSDSVPSWIAAYSMSSAGMALGMILPVQLGMTVARTAGTHAYGRTLKRGTGGTIFEQSFDLLMVVLLGVASTITWVVHAGAAMWMICATAVSALAFVLVGPALWFVPWVLSHASDRMVRLFSSWFSRHPHNIAVRALQSFSASRQSGLASAGLARRLLLVSAARFGIVVLMAEQTSIMAGTHISLWRMAAAVPFSVLSNFIAVTPGGVGVNELTSVTALHAFGVPLDVATLWALANRLLATAACITVTACAFLIVGAKRILHAKSVNIA